MQFLATFGRFIFRCIVIMSVLLSTSPSFADRKVASIRVPPPKAGAQKKFKFTAADQVIMNRAFLDMLVRKYEMAQTFQAFVAEFPPKGVMTDSDLRELKKEYAAHPLERVCIVKMTR